MSDDPLVRKLSLLTPNGTGLDRDALLFAAGRASARPNRRWIALVGALATSQLLTLGGLLWPRHEQPIPESFTPSAPIVVIETPLPGVVETPGLWTLHERFMDMDGKLPMPIPSESLVPSEPPLRAFGPWPKEFLH